MNSCVSFELSSGRAVLITLAAADGRRLTAAEVFEVIRASGRAAGEFETAVGDSVRETQLARVLPRVICRRRFSVVPSQRLASALRRHCPALTTGQILRLLPRVMASRYDSSLTHDLPGRSGAVRGYRGVSFR